MIGCDTTDQARFEDWRNKLRKKIEDEKRPIKIEFKEIWHESQAIHANIGRFCRKSKGRTYESPRILLHWFYSKIIGKAGYVFEGKVSVEGFSFLQDCDALIIVLKGEKADSSG